MSERKACGNSGPSSDPLRHLPISRSGVGWGGAGAAEGCAERREFSGLLLSVLLSLHCFRRESSGAKSQTPSSLALSGMRITEAFLGEVGVSFLPAFLFFSTSIKSVHRVSHCLRFLTLATAQSSPAPRPVGPKPGSPLLLFSVVLLRLPGPMPPQFSDRVQDFVGLFPFLPAVAAQSLSLSKVCDFKQLLLISVSHWCRSSLYCKETYLRLLIAVVRCVPANPVCAVGPVAQVGVVAAVIRRMVSVACRDQLDILSP